MSYRNFALVFLGCLWLSVNANANASDSSVNRDAFYPACEQKFPRHLFKGESRATFDGIFDNWESAKYRDKRWLAYILATAHHESAGTMQPVREGLCDTNKCSIDAVTKLLKDRGKSASDNYALPINGKSYYGRGLVQITHRRNYERVGRALGWGDDLVSDPDLALKRDKAIPILVEGAVQGMFSKDRTTGEWRKLSTYLNESKTDWLGARSIINPGSKRAHIPAETAKKFYECLNT